MNWRSEHIWIELITGSRKISNFCWACILFLGSLGFLLVGTSSYFGRNLISLFPSQQIVFFPQGIVMCFYGIAGLFISSYLWCTISWSVGSGYDSIVSATKKTTKKELDIGTEPGFFLERAEFRSTGSN